ncbi:MAG: hypothetical protein ABID45_04600 [Patescibacteria group bacterium]
MSKVTRTGSFNEPISGLREKKIGKKVDRKSPVREVDGDTVTAQILENDPELLAAHREFPPGKIGNIGEVTGRPRRKGDKIVFPFKQPGGPWEQEIDIEFLRSLKKE